MSFYFDLLRSVIKLFKLGRYDMKTIIWDVVDHYNQKLGTQ